MPRTPLDRLADALVSDLLSTPDDEIMREAEADGIDVEVWRARMLRALERAVSECDGQQAAADTPPKLED